MKTKIQGEPIDVEEFVKSTIEKIKRAADGRIFKDGIAIEVTITKAEKLAAGIKAYVANAGGDLQRESIGKVWFTLYPKSKKSFHPNEGKENKENWRKIF